MTLSIAQLRLSLDRGGITFAELLSMRRTLGTPFRFHPLGFIACTLLTEGSVKLRIHCWPTHDSTQQSSDCQIHDHIFEFKSWVLSGAVENVEYTESISGTEHSVYRTEYRDDQSILTRTGELLRLEERSRMAFGKGTSYSVGSKTLHKTIRIGDEPAFTVLVAKDVSDSAALVLGPKAGLARYSYTRSIVEDEFAETLFSAT